MKKKISCLLYTSVPGVQFYGFRVCSNFSEEPSAGEAAFTLSPRQFLDVNSQPATPDKGFKLTCEMLRRKPDSALVWYEDFRDDTPLPDSYWTTLSGEWSVWRESYTTENRPYSLLEGSGKLAWKYEGFSCLLYTSWILWAFNTTELLLNL